MNDGREWFAPRRYGYGAGWPIAWQGWALLSAFFAIVIAVVVGLSDKPALQAAILFPIVASLIITIAKTTRGGWRWRWGDRD